MRRFAQVLALLLVLAFAAVFGWKWWERRVLTDASTAQAERRPTVLVVTVHSGQGARSLALPGETAAWFESTIYARVSGYVAKWNADIGDHVRQGQTLANIDTPELDAQLNAARAQLNAAEAQVRVREAEAALATTTYERWRDAPKGVVSEQEREEKKAEFGSAEARLGAAHAQAVLNQADVDRYLALTQFKLVTAPFDGTVVERRIDVGNLVTAGSTAATAPLYRMSQDRPIRVYVDVPQSVAADLMKPGLTAQIGANGLSGRVYTGKVARTAQAINPQARTLKVEVDLPNADGSLVPGMYVNVAFQLERSGLAQVPAAALVFRSRGPQVAVVEADGHVRFRDVTIARDEGNLVEIASGVHDGERLALNISSQIAEGDLVVASEPPQETSTSRPGPPSSPASATDAASTSASAAKPVGNSAGSSTGSPAGDPTGGPRGELTRDH